MSTTREKHTQASAPHLVCTRCGRPAPEGEQTPACVCGGLFELDFTPPAWDPALIDRSEWSLFRYRAFMAVEDDVWRTVTMGEGMSPVVPMDPDGRVLLKMDYIMPTLSFKDRGAATLVAHMKAIGVKRCVQDSSGNAGNAVAAYAARAGIECEIYVPEGTSPKKITMIESHGAIVHVVPGTRDHCAEVCRRRVADEGLYYANHVYNPYFYEGTKTYVYEVLEQLGRIPAHLIVPVGNGTLFIGVVKALEHLVDSGAIDRFPHVIALQSERCAPLFKARLEGSPEPARITPEPTMAEGIAIGVPMRGREILEMMKRHDIDVVTAPEDAILTARHDLARRGIYCEHTTAANLAALRAWEAGHGPLDDVLVTMCGAGIKSDH